MVKTKTLISNKKKNSMNKITDELNYDYEYVVNERKKEKRKMEEEGNGKNSNC